MSKRLEDFIKSNKQEFDELEPRAALWDNIESKLWLEDEKQLKERKTFSLGLSRESCYHLSLAESIIEIEHKGYRHHEEAQSTQFFFAHKELGRKSIYFLKSRWK